MPSDDLTRRGFRRAGPTGRIPDHQVPRRRQGPRLTDRDREILHWIGRHGLVLHSQVAERFFRREDGTIGTWAAYRRLKAMEEMGLIRRDNAYWRAPQVLRLTREGARVADCGVGPAKLTLANVAHDIAVVDLMEELLAEHPGAEMTTERELWSQRARDIREGRRRAGQGRMADGMLTLPDGTRIGVELDMTGKRSQLVREIIAAYVSDDYDRVLYHVTSQRLADRYAELVAAERADDLIEVRVWTA